MPTYSELTAGDNYEEFEEWCEERGYDDGAITAYVEYMGYQDSDVDDFLADFEEAYNGTWRSREEFAEDLAESIGAITETNEWPNYCIDWERAARELFYDYWDEAGGQGIYVFRCL